MAVSSSFRAFALEQLGALPLVTSKRMFGGVGVYSDGVFFGLMANDRLYLKVDDQTRPDFEAEGMEPFRPYDDERSMNYYEVPVSVLEDPDALAAWSGRAVEVARRAAAAKKKPKKRS